MKLVGWPSYWNKEDGISPVDIQEIDFQGSPEELTQISNFLIDAAFKLSHAIDNKKSLDLELQLSDSKNKSQLPISISVVRNCER